jgi:homogentisate 1,2-dioxygenase
MITIQNHPCPYNHSNVDSDEVLYYVDGDFMSRNNIEQGHITHPKGFRTVLHLERWKEALVIRKHMSWPMVDTFRTYGNRRSDGN